MIKTAGSASTSLVLDLRKTQNGDLGHWDGSRSSELRLSETAHTKSSTITPSSGLAATIVSIAQD
ncbi:hypothetical protein P7K49_033953, partial [Saguinus oedipus]